jgi:hypothetical protein
MPRGRKKKNTTHPATINVEEAREELRKLVEIEDEPPCPDSQEGKSTEEAAPEKVSTDEADKYILSFFKKP